MKKNLTLLISLLLVLLSAYSCEEAAKPAASDETPITTSTDVPAAPALNYTLSATRVGDFELGGPITAIAKEKGYTIEELTQRREGQEEPVFIVSADGERLLQIFPRYNPQTQGFDDVVGELKVISNRYKLDNGIGVGSSIEEFQKAYADAAFWHTNVGQMFVVETEQVPMQFLLNDSDYVQEQSPLRGERTDLQAAAFKTGSKIASIRIY